MPRDQQRDPRTVLPLITWDSIAPPYPDYHYFEGAREFPFRFQARMFDMVNAWWLIEAATLAYAAEGLVREKFGDAGLPEVALFDGGGTQGFVAHNEDFLILVFRGTEIRRRPGRSDFRNIIVDILTDADALPVDSGHGGRVHHGFKAALDEVWEDLAAYLRSLDNGRRTFWVTGHSLGAALATLAAQRYGNFRGLYTFGSPRVGDLAFKDGFPRESYRFVNHRDIVTRVPPAGLYHHVGFLKYIDSEGTVHNNSHLWEVVLEGIDGEVATALNSWEEWGTGLDALIPQVIVDHVPMLYATHIWNNIP